jgi:F-type H+-transporting ATPase subunit epsilon
MIYRILTKEGLLDSGEITYVVIKNKDGELAILEDHIPIIVHVDRGMIKLVSVERTWFLVLEGAVVEFKENRLSVLALEAKAGTTLENAHETFESAKHKRLEKTKRENIDFSDLERELKENIKKSKAGSA